MALITRITRLIRSDLHAMLDHIEEPDLLLRQAVREMELAVEQDEQRMKLINHESRQLASRVTELKHSQQQTENELDICIESGEDDLARAVIRRRLGNERLLKNLQMRQEGLQSDLAELQARLDENRNRLAAMQQKLELVDVRQESHVGERPYPDGCMPADAGVTGEEIEVALLREKQRRRPS